MGELAEKHHKTQEFMIKELQFDEMESIEHTKLKPLTIALAVSEDFKILGTRVGTIPAKGLLSQISKKKYGPREDQSSLILREMLANLKVSPSGQDFLIKSDAKPSYRAIVKEVFLDKKHLMYVAQENKEKRRELKYTNLEKRVFDPIFAVNQRMAKFRDHIKRLARRSWCTTKRRENLEKQIYLYIADNNRYEFI